MGLTTRQYLKLLSKDQLRQLFKETDLTEDEYWLLTYAFIERRMVVNTCCKLSISQKKYHTMLNEALIKIHYTLKNNPKMYSLL